MHWQRPAEGEYIPYQKAYLDKVPDGDIPDTLERQLGETLDLLSGLPPEKLQYRYAEGKWNIPQILQHLIDTERIMAYRALCFARGDSTPLPGFEQEDYAREANTEERTLGAMLEEYAAVRRASILLFRSMNDALLQRSGTANKGTLKVNTLAWVIAGHEIHHTGIIRERYLGV